MFVIRYRLCVILAFLELNSGVGLLILSNDWTGRVLGAISVLPLIFYMIMFGGCLVVYENIHGSTDTAKPTEIFKYYREAGYTSFDVVLRVFLSIFTAFVIFAYTVYQLPSVLFAGVVLLLVACLTTGYCLVRSKDSFG